MRSNYFFFIFVILFFSCNDLFPQLILSGTEPIVEDFNSMGTSKTATLPSGFRISAGSRYETSSSLTTQSYGTSGSGIVSSSSAGGTVNWANGFWGDATDRALGFLMTDSYSQPYSIMVRIRNNTTKTITQFSVSWDYEKYRSGTRATSWVFYTGLNGSNWIQQSEGNQAYSSDLDNSTVFNPPASIKKTVHLTGLSIAPETDYYLRWACTSLNGSSNCQGLGIDNLTISDFNTIRAENSQNVSASGLVNFNGEPTGIGINIQSIGGSGQITVQRHNSIPLNTTSIPLSNISNYRWVITPDAGITNINCQLRFYLNDIPDHGINEGTSSIKLFKRETPGSGTFQDVGTLAYHNLGEGQTNDYLSIDGITSFSEFVFASDEPMPVDLISFTSKIKENLVTLNWSTACEVNNVGFEIERGFENKASNLNVRWEKIGFVQGKGNSNSRGDYSFTEMLDIKIALRSYGKLLYRLKQINTDGSYSYSRNIEVSPYMAPDFSLFPNYPNPFNSTTIISYNLPEAGVVSIKLYDINGRGIAEIIKQNQQAGYHNIELSADKYMLTSGFYYYTLEIGNYFAIRKIIYLK